MENLKKYILIFVCFLIFSSTTTYSLECPNVFIQRRKLVFLKVLSTIPNNFPVKIKVFQTTSTPTANLVSEFKSYFGFYPSYLGYLLLNYKSLSTADIRKNLSKIFHLDFSKDDFIIEYNLPNLSNLLSFSFDSPPDNLSSIAFLQTEAKDTASIECLHYPFFVIQKNSRYILVYLYNNKFLKLSDFDFDSVKHLHNNFFIVTIGSQDYLFSINDMKTRKYNLLSFDKIQYLNPSSLIIKHSTDTNLVINTREFENSHPLLKQIVIPIPSDLSVYPMDKSIIDQSLMISSPKRLSFILDPIDLNPSIINQVLQLSRLDQLFAFINKPNDAFYTLRSKSSKSLELYYSSTLIINNPEQQIFYLGSFDQIEPVFKNEHELEFFILKKDSMYALLDVKAIESLDSFKTDEQFIYTSIKVKKSDSTQPFKLILTLTTDKDGHTSTSQITR